MRAFLVALLLAVLSLGPIHLLGAQDLDSSLIDRIDAHITAFMESEDIPGAALGIVQGDQIVYLQGYGTAGDDRPMTPQTPFLLASLSKSFTGMAIMQLVEAGDLDLNSPVNEILDWFPYEGITVSHLLYQTSGFSEFSGHDYISQGLRGPDALDTTMRQMMSDYSPQTSPGENYEYSNTNYDLLGLIVQTLSGQPYGDYVQEHIFTPLAMTNSFTSLETAQSNGLSSGYSASVFGRRAVEPVYSGGQVASSGLFSSAEDMSHYLIAQLNGGQYGEESLLSAEGIDSLHSPGTTDGPYWGYGMGWQRWPFWEAVQFDGLYSATMPVRIYHDGSWHNFRTYQELLPERDLGVVVLLNANDDSRESVYWNSIYGVLQILTGVEELSAIEPSEDWLVQNQRWITVLLTVAWILMTLLALRRILQWWRDPARRPRHPLHIAAVILIPTLLDIGILYLILVALPDIGVSPLHTILAFTLDIRLAIFILVPLAAGWGLLRTLIYVWLLLLRGGRAAPATAPATA